MASAAKPRNAPNKKELKEVEEVKEIKEKRECGEVCAEARGGIRFRSFAAKTMATVSMAAKGISVAAA